MQYNIHQAWMVPCTIRRVYNFFSLWHRCVNCGYGQFWCTWANLTVFFWKFINVVKICQKQWHIMKVQLMQLNTLFFFVLIVCFSSQILPLTKVNSFSGMHYRNQETVIYFSNVFTKRYFKVKMPVLFWELNCI